MKYTEEVEKELKKLEESRSIYQVIKIERNQPEEFKKWSKDLMMEIEWKLYEDVCKEFLQIKNIKSEVTNTGADGGIDIKVTTDKGKVLAIAQCKAQKKQIGVALIRELYGVMTAENIKQGMFFTTSNYSPDAKDFAKGKGIALVDCDGLFNAINNLNETDREKIENLISNDKDYKTPTCANCNIKLIRRKAKTGKNIGSEFWGCTNFPRCRSRIKIKPEI